jgi:hypothetical protein
MTEQQTDALLEILGGLYIQNLRIYDLLAVIADKQGADVIALKELHRQGQVLCPDPALVVDLDKEQRSN